MHFVYVLYSRKTDSFYIGETSNIENRLLWHNNKEFQKAYTKITDDWGLYFQINCIDIIQARKIENHIKAMKSKIYIENLNKFPEISTKLLTKYS
ncbi:GIY-YIG nuclease family protein [Flavobacterium sp.]|uniref:GIY-YIG nuclease family protein n=1 Tax=Flavobacterium sp. TaxID=239 RepID=UPI00374D3D37